MLSAMDCEKKGQCVSISTHYPNMKPKYPGYKRHNMVLLEPESVQQRSGDGAAQSLWWEQQKITETKIKIFDVNFLFESIMTYTPGRHQVAKEALGFTFGPPSWALCPYSASGLLKAFGGRQNRTHHRKSRRCNVANSSSETTIAYFNKELFLRENLRVGEKLLASICGCSLRHRDKLNFFYPLRDRSLHETVRNSQP